MAEKINICLDSSQIAQYGNCPLAWFYRFQENLEVLDAPPKEALDKGTLVHHLLDIFYNYMSVNPTCNRYNAATETIKFFQESEVTKRLGLSKEMETFLCSRFLQYVGRWQHDDFRVPILNGVPGVELGFSKLLYEDQHVRFIVEGRIDLVIEFQGGFAFVDHKSQDRANMLYQYTPQFKTYAWATGYDYGIINYFRLQKEYKDNNTFYRQLINFTTDMIEDWREYMLNIFWRVYASIQSGDPEFFFNYFRNMSSCAGSFNSNPCMYHHICEVSQKSQKDAIKSFKYQKVEPWVPWALKELKNEGVEII